MDSAQKPLDYSILSKYRGILMCIAILMVVFFHMLLADIPPAIDRIKGVCYGGVDIFLFVSGLGCFYSLSKDGNSFNFMKRRLSKLLPMLWIFLVIWFLYKIIINDPLSLKSIIGNLFLIQDFTAQGQSFNWYLSAIFLFYLLAPILFESLMRNKISTIIIVLLLSILASIPFIRNNSMLIIATRLSIFYIGMLFGKLSNEHKTIQLKHLALLSLCAAVGIIILNVARDFFPDSLWTYGLNWYPLILIVPTLCLWISLLCNKISNCFFIKKANKILLTIGNHTFEIYLCHILIFDIYLKLVNDGIIPHSNRNVCLSVLLIIPSCFALYWATKLLTRYIPAAVVKTIRKGN